MTEKNNIEEKNIAGNIPASRGGPQRSKRKNTAMQTASATSARSNSAANNKKPTVSEEKRGGSAKRSSGAQQSAASERVNRKKASRSTLFDFPDITPDAEENGAEGFYGYGAEEPEDNSRSSGKGARPGRASSAQAKESAERKTETKLRIIPLGGLGEIGKNMMAVEFGQDIVVIDCGMGFPEEDMPGIDLVIPDISYLTANREKVRGILLTHGHEDHIGAIPYVLKQLNVPVYGTALTLGIIRYKLSEHHLDFKPQLITVKAGDKVKLGVFEAEFIHVNHSIADSCAIALNTPRGLIVHSGDFKLDVTPIEGEMMDLTRFGELGRKGVKLLMCESTNAERSGFTPSERSVGGTLENLFTANPDKRIVVATFSSNVHRGQQIIDISVRHGRRVALTGRSMLNVVSAACELGYMHFPEGTLVDIGDIKRFRPGDLTLITTGSQGEPMSALYRMA